MPWTLPLGHNKRSDVATGKTARKRKRSIERIVSSDENSQTDDEYSLEHSGSEDDYLSDNYYPKGENENYSVVNFENKEGRKVKKIKISNKLLYYTIHNFIW